MIIFDNIAGVRSQKYLTLWLLLYILDLIQVHTAIVQIVNLIRYILNYFY
jgi:hypothetical protein